MKEDCEELTEEKIKNKSDGEESDRKNNQTGKVGRMTLSTTIKKVWWNRKMEQYKQKGYFYEYKRYNSYWDVRLSKINALPIDAVFLVGSVPHRASITRICHASMYDIPSDICRFLFCSDTNARMSDMVWVLKCENVIEVRRNVPGITSHAREERVVRTFYPERKKE